MEKTFTTKKSTKGPALGKGFNSLLGVEKEVSLSTDLNQKNIELEGNIIQVPIEKVLPNPGQPRKLFKDQELQELSKSIKVDGVIQPIIVSKDEDKNYVIVAGERRWRASKLAGLVKVPVIVKQGTKEELLRLSLIENIQRSDLNIIEEAEAYAALINDFGLTQERCSETVGKDRSTITNALRLLALPNEIKNDLIDGILKMGHGRALLALSDKKDMLRARDIVIKKKLSVRQTEKLVKSFKNGQRSGAVSEQPQDADLTYIAENLRNHLRTKVKIAGNPNRGKLEVSYFSAGELERILGVMGIQFD